LNYRKSHTLKVALGFTLATCCLQGAVAGTQYRWENERGVVEYSDRPPPAGVEYETIDTDPGLNYEPDQSEGEASPQEPAVASPDTATGQAAADNVIQRDAALCEKARMNLIALEHEESLSVHNNEGNEKLLSQADREYAIAKAKRQIDRFCE